MFVTTFTATPQVGQEFEIDRPDWVARGTITSVTPHNMITGHDGTAITREIDPTRFDIEVVWDINSAETDDTFFKTVRVEA